MANVYNIAVKRKSDPDEYRDPRVKHLEEWVKVSDDARKNKLGENFFQSASQLYENEDSGGPSPSFRPLVRIPELQKMMLEDVNQLSEMNPKLFVFDDGEQSEDREKALQAQWQMAAMNQHFLYASLTARYCGTGFLLCNYDPDLRGGKGGFWAKSLDPRNVGFDPTTDYTWDPAYTFYQTPMHLEEVRKKWPLTSRNIKARHGTTPQPGAGDTDGYGIGNPPGPMTSVGHFPSTTSPVRGSSDTRVMVRTFFFKDYTRELVQERDLPDGELTSPEFLWKYPNGRWIVECEGVILLDGDNPHPRRRDLVAPHFPIFPVWSLPPLFSPWGIPVTRMTQDLQALAQRMYTQTFENAIRLNNGVWFIEQNTGINPEAFGGLPGEAQTINAGSKVPQCVFPPPMPSQMTELPQKLLGLQKEVLGYTDSRQGKPGAGNVSTDLFDASVLQSSGVLQLSGKLMANAVESVGQFMFDMMLRYFDRQSVPFRGDNGIDIAKWAGLSRPETYDLMLDETSVRPLSNTVIRRMIPDLMKTGILSTKRGLEMLEFPHADKIAEEQRQNLELQALGKVRGAKK